MLTQTMTTQWYTRVATKGVVASAQWWRPSGLLRMASNFNSSSSSNPDDVDSIFKQKRMLRTQVRKTLKAIDPSLRSQQDNAIQDIILRAPWFRSSLRLCAYISCSALREVDTFKLLSEILQPSLSGGKKLYVPRVEDKNSHMRMLNISRIDDLIANSMDILEPAPVDADGNAREDAAQIFEGSTSNNRCQSWSKNGERKTLKTNSVSQFCQSRSWLTVMQASDPVDLFLLPGLAFDRSGRRLGRGGGYYDTFLKNYQDLAKTRNWKQPLLVALSYSQQILDEGVIPITSSDAPIDALVSPEGVIPISTAAFNRMDL